MRTFLTQATHTVVFRWLSALLPALFLFGLAVQGFTSAYRLYPSAIPGYRVQAFDSTPRWAGTRALFLQGISPYSPAADAIIQTQYFGRPLQDADKAFIRDRQGFAYPLYIVWLYLPLIFFDFSTVLVILWVSMAAAFVAGCWLWFKILSFPSDILARLFALAILLALPTTFTALQTRQPTLWVWFFLAVAIFLMRRQTPFADGIAGFFIVLACIKPQSAILVIGYILIVYYLVGRGLRASRWFLLGFGLTAAVLLGSTWALQPGWLAQFLVAAQSYREYAGATGAEAVAGPQSPLALVLMALAILPWLGMVAYQLKRRTFEPGHLLTIGYALVLQIVIFPTHSINFVFVIPLVLLGCRWLWSARSGAPKWAQYALAGSVVSAIYLAFYNWLNIAVEGAGPAVVGTLRQLLPGRIFLLPLLALLSGAILYWLARTEFERKRPPVVPAADLAAHVNVQP